MSAQSYNWSRTTDIIIVGGGGAGLAAAVEATRYTPEVVVLEKEAAPGGTTALAIGSISCGGTKRGYSGERRLQCEPRDEGEAYQTGNGGG